MDWIEYAKGPNYVIDYRREPIHVKVETDCCPTCKQPLNYTEALNDGTICACGEWWHDDPFAWVNYGTASGYCGWHFKPKNNSNRQEGE